MRATIINATSYFGLELVRLLSTHPNFGIHELTGRSHAGRRFGEVFPHAQTFGDGSVARVRLVPTEDAAIDTDIAFSCLPHMASAEVLAPYIQSGVRVIDVSADLRLKSADDYQAYYGHPHPRPELLDGAVYGLPELHRAEIVSARAVGNPGCYPTAAILSVAPALAEGLIEPDLVIDAKSGVSGAGRSLKLDSHYSEVTESIHAYGVDGHRHVAEMIQELELIAAREVAVTFIPHLTPMIRGILSTGYARLNHAVEPGAVNDLYRDYYADAPFALALDQPPRSKWVAGSNFCAVHARPSPDGRRLLMFGVVDNLVKGAAGQALQNANLMAGFDERCGLESAPAYP
jgi:N-acetyl-gamma-glutamyl-phosphate reductase